MNIKKLLISGFLIFVFFMGCSDSNTKSKEINEIQIGALIPLTGDYEKQGDEILSALNNAVIDINNYFVEENKNTEIKLVYRDTETNADIANVQLQSLLAENIRIIVGPLTSSELLGVQDNINSSESILISPSSTLVSLAIENDNIYRIVPNDSKMIEATIEVMWQEGIRNLALFHSDNAWGNSFTEIIQEKFEAKGGNFLGNVSYIGGRTSELEEYLGELSELIDSQLPTIDPSTIAVQMISLDVGSVLLDLASDDTTLGKVKWYGCDGFVNSDDLFLFENGSKFAKDVEFTSPIFGCPSTEESQDLINRIISDTGDTPGAYSLLTYDALAVAAKTLENIGEDVTLTELKNALQSTITDYQGLSGEIEFNDAGDRSNGDYFFWRIMPDGNNYKWEHVKSYIDGHIE